MMDGQIVALVMTPAERMAEAVQELRAAQAEFDLAGPEAFEAVNARLTAARAKVALILADARAERGRLRCCYYANAARAAKKALHLEEDGE